MVDLLYAMAGAAGAAPLLSLPPLRLGLGLLGAAVLGLLGVRSVWSAVRVQTGTEVAGDIESPGRAFRTSLGATAANPLTIASWGAIFAAATTGARVTPGGLVAGVGLGSLAWTALLAGLVAAAGRMVGSRGLRLADGLAGVGMLGFAGSLGWHALRDG